MDGFYGSRGYGAGAGYQPRNIQEQVDRIMQRLGGGPNPMGVPDDGISQSYAQPAPPSPPRHWRDVADGIAAQLEREQAARPAQEGGGFGLIGPAQAQIAVPIPPPPIPGVPQIPDMGRQLIDFLSAAVTGAQRRLGEANDAIRRRDGRSFQSYTKQNLDTPNVYAGRTGNIFDPRTNVYLRDRAGHPTGNYAEARLDCSSNSYGAIRGREQELIDHFRAQGLSDNQINGIWFLNPLRGYYLEQAMRECGYLPMPGSENR
ncbi:MAG: hypothetical protein ACT4N4_03520 [Rhodospirillales bacterium]